ncbi:MAG: 30S ribosomal protein S6 [Candidatus Shapirobacteria bacterium]
MNLYELTLVLDPDLKSEEQKKLVEKIEKMIVQAKGKAEKVLEWGKKELAYPIRKKTLGYYYHLPFTLPAKAVFEIDRKIRLENGVIRYLLVRSEGKKDGAKIAK